MIYFLPNDRPYQASVVDSMKTTIRQIQTFYSEQMQAHGYGEKTFRFETDDQEEPLVHQVDGRHPDSHYSDEGESVIAEIEEAFDVLKNVYFIVMIMITIQSTLAAGCWVSHTRSEKWWNGIGY